MSSRYSDNLSKEKIRQLLAAMGKTGGQEELTEAAKYDWRKPHYFNQAQLRNLHELADQAAASIAARFVQLYQGGVNVKVRAVTQQFGSQFCSEIMDDARSDHYLAFGPKTQPALGLVGLAQETAIAWVTQLLCDSESEEDSAHSQSEPAGRALSQLEESLLTDVAVAVVKAFCASLPGFDRFEPGQALATGQLPIEISDTAEICKFTFDVQKADSEDSHEVYIVVPCGTLAPLAGKAAATKESMSAEDISKALLEHVQQMPVTVTAYLASTAFSFEGVMDLQTNDILVFDNGVHQPIDITVEGQTLFCARPAKVADQYAVVITGLRDDTAHDAKKVSEE